MPTANHLKLSLAFTYSIWQVTSCGVSLAKPPTLPRRVSWPISMLGVTCSWTWEIYPSLLIHWTARALSVGMSALWTCSGPMAKYIIQYVCLLWSSCPSNVLLSRWCKLWVAPSSCVSDPRDNKSSPSLLLVKAQHSICPNQPISSWIFTTNCCFSSCWLFCSTGWCVLHV